MMFRYFGLSVLASVLAGLVLVCFAYAQGIDSLGVGLEEPAAPAWWRLVLLAPGTLALLGRLLMSVPVIANKYVPAINVAVGSVLRAWALTTIPLPEGVQVSDTGAVILLAGIGWKALLSVGLTVVEQVATQKTYDTQKEKAREGYGLGWWARILVPVAKRSVKL